jgi:hypothetical protein
VLPESAEDAAVAAFMSTPTEPGYFFGPQSTSRIRAKPTPFQPRDALAYSKRENFKMDKCADLGRKLNEQRGQGISLRIGNSIRFAKPPG